MDWYFYLIIGVGAFILGLLAIILIRTLSFKPKKQELATPTDVKFSQDEAVNALRELIRCKTISHEDKSLEDDAEFEKLINLLPKLYPYVTNNCELKTFDGRALLYRWKGKNDGNPSVLMSHYDVVSVVEKNWSKPPFDGVIEDGRLWGRGALDTKATFNGVMFSVNELIKQGFTPENDIYLAFSGGEEVNGEGAGNIVNYFKENNVNLEMVIDEGGAVVTNVFPGVKKACGLIGIAEKGMMNVRYTIKSQGGHSSAPKPNSPIVALSKACIQLETHPFKYHLTKPVKEMFDTLGRHSNFVYKMIFSNMWLFEGILNKIAVGTGGEMNALLRTTVAFTQAEGSKGVNVLPPVASFTTNMRLNPKDSVDSAYEYLKKTVDNDKIDVEVLAGVNPSRISRTDVDGYKRIATAINATWGNDVVVAPYLMVQCSDSRSYGAISDRVYRFSAMDLTSDERSSIHGNDESIRLETVSKCVEFYINLIKQC